MNKFITFLILILIFSIVSAGEPIKSNGNIGLEFTLNQAIIKQTGLEAELDCDLTPVGDGNHFLDCEFSQEFWLDATTMNLGQFKQKYSRLAVYFPRNSDFVRWVKLIRDDGFSVETKGNSERKDNAILRGRRWQTKLKLGKGQSNKIKIGENSMDIYFDDGLVETTVVPEVSNDCRAYPEFNTWKCNSQVELHNHGLGQIDISRENFGASGIDFDLFYKSEWIEDFNINIPIYNEDFELIGWDYNVPRQKVDGQWNILLPVAYEDEFENPRINFQNFITVKPSESLTIKYSYFTNTPNGKWDFVFYYDGDSYLIDPYWSASAGSDLNANFSLSSYVDEFYQPSYLGWKATGELDWNSEARNDTTSGGWGELVTDYNVQVGNLQGLWHLNDNAFDSSGNGNNGTLENGATANASGLWNTNALTLDGTNDYLGVPDDDVLSPNIITVSMWAKFTNAGDTPVFLMKDHEYVIQAVESGVDVIRVGVSFSGTTFNLVDSVRTSSSLEGDWHHYILTFDGSTVSLYIDGVFDNSGSYSGSIQNTANDLGIGIKIVEEGGIVAPLNGEVEEVAIWDTALTNQEVKELYEAQKGQWLDENLVAYYKFNDVDGTTVFDSARGHDGVLTNGASIESYGMWDTNALTLDGVNDYVSVADNDSFDFNTMSFSVWINTNLIGNYDGVLMKSTGSSWNDGWGLSAPVSTNLMRFWINSWNTNYIQFEVPMKRWIHIIGTYDRSNIKLYMNGILIGTQAYSSAINHSNNGLLIGKSRDVDSYCFNGLIEEVKIYDRVLTQEEISADYNSFLEAKFVDANVVATEYADNDWNAVKINSDVNYSFNKQICAVGDTECNTEKWQDSLVGLWHLNDNALDSSGQNNNGTWSGSEAYVSGLWNTNAGTFDGSTDYITVTDDDSLDIVDEGTFSFWLKRDRLGVTERILDKGTGQYTIFLLNSDDKLYFAKKGVGPIAKSNIIPVDVWVYVTILYDGLDAEIFINGMNETTFVGSLALTSNSTNLFIGSSITPNAYFDGEIEEVAIWDRTLDTIEIRDLYRKGVSRLDLNVLACSDATCDTITDSLLIEDANNNSWLDISSLNNSQYFNYETLFTQNPDFTDKTAGFFHVGGFLQDVNLEYFEFSGETTAIKYAGIERFFENTTTETTSPTFQTVLEVDHNTEAINTPMVIGCDFDSNGQSNTDFSADYQIQYKFGGATWTTVGTQSASFGGGEPLVYRHNMIVTKDFNSPANMDNNIQIRLQQKRVGGTGVGKAVYLNNPECQLIKAIDENGLLLSNISIDIDESTVSTTYESVQAISFPAPSYFFSIFTIGGVQFLQTGAKGTPHIRLVFDSISPEYLRTVDDGASGSGGVSGATTLLSPGFPADGNIEIKTTAGTGRIISEIFNVGIAPDTNESIFTDLNNLSFGNGQFHAVKTISFDNKNQVGDFRGSASVPYDCNNSMCQMEMFMQVVGNGYDSNSVVRRNTSANTVGDYRMISPQFVFEDLPVGNDFNFVLWGRTTDSADGLTTKGGILTITKFNSESIPSKDIWTITLDVKDSVSLEHLDNVSVDCNANGDYDFDMNSPQAQTFVEGSYSCEFSRVGYDSNTIVFVSDSSKTVVVYLSEIIVVFDFVTPVDGGSFSNPYTYFIVSSNDGNIVDVNYFLNGGGETNFSSSCVDVNVSTSITCASNSLIYVPNSWNDFNVCVFAGDNIYCDDFNAYFNPDKDWVIPSVEGGFDLFLILIVLAGIIVFIYFIKIKER